MNYLDLDLNRIVNKQVAEEIKALEKTVKSLREDKQKLKEENKLYQETVKRTESTLLISDSIKKAYKEIGKNPSEQYDFIKSIMKTLFGIEEAYKFYQFGLALNLAINFYDHKKLLIPILEILNDIDYMGRNKVIPYITEFRMPYGYTHERILKYVKNPHYNTNGAFGISQYWNGGDINLPHDLLLKNPVVMESDIWAELIKTVNGPLSDRVYLYAVYKYQNLDAEKIQELGRTLIGKINRLKSDSIIGKFIKVNLYSFDNDTIDYLYTLISSDNQFKLLHWGNFPIKWQKKHLMNKNIEEVIKLFSNYSCKWTIEEKDSFLKEYYKK